MWDSTLPILHLSYGRSEVVKALKVVFWVFFNSHWTRLILFEPEGKSNFKILQVFFGHSHFFNLRPLNPDFEEGPYLDYRCATPQARFHFH